jgi:hypothetical protein
MRKKDFWSTLPGILTGIAAMLSALTGIYLAVRTGDRPPPRSGGDPSPRRFLNGLL